MRLRPPSFADEGIALADQLVVEGGDGADLVHRGGELALEAGGVHRLSGRCAEHQRVAGLELRLEGAGHPEVFAAVEAAAHLVRIGDALVPVRSVLERTGRGAQLQVQVREARIHVEGGAVLYGLIVRAGLVVFSGEGMEVTESQERLELQLHLGGCFFQLILDEKLVLIGTKDDGLAEHDFPDFVSDGGNRVCIEVHDVLVAAGIVDVPVAVDSQVEPLAAEGQALIEGTQQEYACSRRTVPPVQPGGRGNAACCK